MTISERQGPTRSEQTNQLLSLCQGVLDGQVSEQALRDALDAREQALVAARREFADGLAAITEGDGPPPSWEPYAQAVLVGFGENAEALAAIRVGLRQKGAALEAAMKALVLSTDRLVLATDAYEARLVSEGPSPHPMQNFLINMSEAIKRGDLSKEAYADILGKGRVYFESCMSEMRNAPAGEPPEAIAALLAAFGQCRDGIAELGRYLSDGDAAHLDSGLEWLEKGQTAVAEGFALHRRQKFAEGPTSSPIANTFISAAQMVKQGQYPVETFENDVAALREHLAKIRAGFEGICQAASSNPAIQEEIPLAMEAFDVHEEAIEAYQRFLEHRNVADLEQGNAKLIEAMKRLDEAKMTFESISESEGKVHCPRCGTLNATGTRVCGACNAALPWLAPGSTTSFAIGEGGEVDSSAQTLVVTDHMKRVIEDTNRVAAGEITGDQYCATLDWMGRLACEGQAGLAATPGLVVESFPEAEQERARAEKDLVDQTREMLTAAMADLQASLDELRRFVDDGDQDHLIKGLREYWDASQRIYQVQRIGEMAARAAGEAPGAPDEGAAESAGAPGADAVDIASE